MSKKGWSPALNISICNNSLNERKKQQFESSEYLRLMVIRKLFENERTKLKESKEKEVLQGQITSEKLKLKKLQLESDIEQKNYEKNVTDRIKELKEVMNELSLIQDNRIKEKADKLIGNLKNLHETLFLKDVKPFNTDKEFQHFLKAFDVCLDTLSAYESDFARLKSFNELLSNIKNSQQLVKEYNVLKEIVTANSLKLYDETLNRSCLKLEKEMQSIIRLNLNCKK